MCVRHRRRAVHAAIAEERFSDGFLANTAVGVVIGLLAIPFIWMIIVLIFFYQGIQMPTFDHVLTPLQGLVLAPFMTLLGWGIVGLFLSGCVIFLIVMGMIPTSTESLKSELNPILDYDAAITRLELIKKDESAQLGAIIFDVLFSIEKPSRISFVKFFVVGSQSAATSKC